MMGIRWKRAVDGAFGDAKDWKGGAAPGPADAALLEAAGADYTVTSAKAETVDSIDLAANATLDVKARTFTATAGTGSGVNAGTIGVYGTATFAVGGDLDDSGTISLNNVGAMSQVDATNLIFVADTTLSGGGNIDLDDSFYNDILGNGVTLTNVDDVISGSGYVGSIKAQLEMINDSGGVINATGFDWLDIDLGGSNGGGHLTNNGLLEGTGAGGLLIAGATIDGSSGAIVAGQGSSVQIIGCNVSGQSLAIQSSGAIDVDESRVTVMGPVNSAGLLAVATAGRGNSNLILNSVLTNSGELEVYHGTLAVSGAVTGTGDASIDHGTMEFDSGFSQNVEFIGAGGAGSLVLGDSQNYGGTISNLARNGQGNLDLRDIGFVSPSEATFNGSGTSGVLTVTDGTHTARIELSGDYLSTHFIASSDGQGGTIVVGEGGGRAGSPHTFIAAMASLVGPAGHPVDHVGPARETRDAALAIPHVANA